MGAIARAIDLQWSRAQRHSRVYVDRSAMTQGKSLPTRVLMIADTMSGVFRHSLELAYALSRLEVELALATMGKSLSSEQRDAIARLSNVELFESEWKLEWMDDPWDD